jgi:hypothetical protein
MEPDGLPIDATPHNSQDEEAVVLAYTHLGAAVPEESTAQARRRCR